METISILDYFKDNYEVLIIFGLLVIEVILRKIPSYKDNTLTSKAIKLLDLFVRNNIKKQRKK
tara:strand:- start:526 stop:714 length:189 start_codon:yes stop_codon:yes gene_type:complete